MPGIGDPAALFSLVIDYIKQETLSPLKGLGRYLLFGIAGSVVVCIGIVLIAVGILRLLQGETGHFFDGSRSWMPYVVLWLGGVLALVVVVKRIGGGPAAKRSRREAGE